MHRRAQSQSDLGPWAGGNIQVSATTSWAKTSWSGLIFGLGINQEQCRRAKSTSLKGFTGIGRRRCLQMGSQPSKQGDEVAHDCLANKTNGGGPKTLVRCGLPFAAVAEVTAPPSQFSVDPVNTLFLLLKQCVPLAREVFTGIYHPNRLLLLNEYVFEKAFVYGIPLLSKWLGEAYFPQGIHGRWPPPTPAEVLPAPAPDPQ